MASPFLSISHSFVTLEAMLAPLVPSPLDYIGRRAFVLYPPIRHPDPNEWRLGTSSWADVQVVNVHTGRDVWIARQYIAGVSESEASLLTVGLTEELEYRAGTVTPRIHRVIEMPAGAAAFRESLSAFGREPRAPARVEAIRLEPEADSHTGKALLTICIGALVVALVSLLIFAADRIIQ